jgi:hypothetical protein
MLRVKKIRMRIKPGRYREYEKFSREAKLMNKPRLKTVSS